MTLAVVNELLESLAALMDSDLLVWAAPLALVGWLVYMLLLTVHELGHAVVGLMSTSGRVFLRVGRAPGLIHGRLGRLETSWNILGGHAGEDDGAVALEVPILEPRAGLLFALAGPVANVFFALLLIPSYTALSGIPQICIAAIIASSLLVAAWNLVTWSPRSDGRAALSALRSINAPRRARSR